jgi:hypothetical protein
VEKSKTSSKGIKKRILESINGWKEKFLSHAGKMVLIKIVIQAISTYNMNVFMTCKALCWEISFLILQLL